jgi:hypothetical protein
VASVRVTGPWTDEPQKSTLAAPVAVTGPLTDAPISARSPPERTVTGPEKVPPSTQVLLVTVRGPLPPDVSVWEHVTVSDELPLEPV